MRKGLGAVTQCNLVWTSPVRGDIRCLEALGHSYDIVHRNGTSYVAVGYEDQLNGRWINLNLEDGKVINKEIDELEALQRRLKSAFAKDELDGGWKAALDHPLYLQAQAEIERLNQELKLLI